MNRTYTAGIAVVTLIAGFFFGRYCQGPGHDLGGSKPLVFSPNTAVVRVTQGTAQKDDGYYYINVLNYNTDSVTIASLDSGNTKNALTISPKGTNYELTVSKAGVNAIPTFRQTSYALVDSTIYSRYGVIYGTDTSGNPQSFNIGDIVSVQGGGGTVTYTFVPIETSE